MAKFYAELNDETRAFIAEQKVFFVATAPTNGSINLSPKGMDTLRCLDDRTVAYLDITGSGNETAAHLNDNGRMTMMFCSFSEKPLILRLRGHGHVVHQRDADWSQLAPLFPPLVGARQIIVLHIESVQTSCGDGVPVYEFKHERENLVRYWAARGEAGVRAYWESNNLVSIDGLPTRLLEG
jgi:predicted pyridoxine 5'-phosphate oxidase superfamily flavin-nucleotide-binding protein